MLLFCTYNGTYQAITPDAEIEIHTDLKLDKMKRLLQEFIQTFLIGRKVPEAHISEMYWNLAKIVENW